MIILIASANCGGEKIVHALEKYARMVAKETECVFAHDIHKYFDPTHEDCNPYDVALRSVDSLYKMYNAKSPQEFVTNASELSTNLSKAKEDVNLLANNPSLMIEQLSAALEPYLKKEN